MSLCETSLNDDVEILETLDGYNFVPLNHPSGNKRGGNLPLKIRKDLSFNECLVCEVPIHSLIEIVKTIRTCIENKHGCGIFIDLKKAFDTVNHDILLQKLEHEGIRNTSLS